jgi:hypothetical protein
MESESESDGDGMELEAVAVAAPAMDPILYNAWSKRKSTFCFRQGTCDLRTDLHPSVELLVKLLLLCGHTAHLRTEGQPGAVPFLPDELWVHILRFVLRNCGLNLGMSGIKVMGRWHREAHWCYGASVEITGSDVLLHHYPGVGAYPNDWNITFPLGFVDARQMA